MRKWNELSMSERASIIMNGVANGVTSLSELRSAYNTFAEGGDIGGGRELNSFELALAEREAAMEEESKSREEANPQFAKHSEDLSFLLDQYKYATKFYKDKSGRLDYKDRVEMTPYENNTKLGTKNPGWFNGAKIPTSVLDYLYDNSRTMDEFKKAFGLASYESTLGVSSSQSYNKDGYINPISLFSYDRGVGQSDYVLQSDVNFLFGLRDKYNKGEKISSKEMEQYSRAYDKLKKEYDNLHEYKGGDVFREALAYFDEGKYNPGNPKHTENVMHLGEIGVNNPAIQEWLATKPYKPQNDMEIQRKEYADRMFSLPRLRDIGAPNEVMQ